jgi:hypothetical protein
MTMIRWPRIAAVAVGLLLSAVAIGRGQPGPTGKPNFSGVWTLNRELSDVPVDPGTAVSASRPNDDQDDRGAGSSRGTPGRSNSRGRSDRFGDDGFRGERYGRRGAPDARRAIEDLIADLRMPSPSLTISHGEPALIVTDAKDRTRVFQTTGRRDPHQVGPATVVSTTKWEGDRVVTAYDLGGARTIRVVYSLLPATRQLVEQITFATGETTRRVYDSARSPRRP